MDRLNPTIIEEPGYEWVAPFLAEQRVEVGGVAAVPFRGQRRRAARRRRLRRVDPRPATVERARLRRSGTRPRAEPRSTTRTAPFLPPAAAHARRRLQAPPRRALRHRLRPPLHDRQHADQALRLMAALEGCVRRVHGRAARVAPPRERRRRDVPDARERRLRRATSTTATSIRCCGSRSGAGRSRGICATCSRRRSTATRSRRRGTATGARRVRGRAAAGRSSPNLLARK